MSSPSRRRRSYIAALGLCVGAAIAVAGLAVAGSDEPHKPADPPSPLEATGTPLNLAGPVEQPGPGMPLDKAISQVLGQSGMKPITSITVVAAPASGPDANVPWLAIDITADSLAQSGQVETVWRAALAEGAIADLHHTDEPATNQVIGGATIRAILPDRDVDGLDGGGGSVATGQTFSATDLNDNEIIQSASATLRDFDLEPVDVQVLHPLSPALYVIARLPDSAGDPTWTVDDLRNALTGTPVAYEGIYIEIQSGDGRPLLAGGTSYRAGLGGLWFADGQDERFGAVHG